MQPEFLEKRVEILERTVDGLSELPARVTAVEAQILTAGFFVGRTMTGQIGAGSRRGSFEYGVDFMPVFLHFRPQRVYGGGLDPVILRWNSSLHIGRAALYIELGGGAVRTSSKPPFG